MNQIKPSQIRWLKRKYYLGYRTKELGRGGDLERREEEDAFQHAEQ